MKTGLRRELCHFPNFASIDQDRVHVNGQHYSPEQKSIALVAHDSQKANLLDWAEYNKHILRANRLYATGTTGLCPTMRATDSASSNSTLPRRYW